MWVLGLNGPPIGWHDGAACLVDGTGRVWGMAEEERFTRVKHATRTPPTKSAQFCLDQAGIAPEDLDAVAIGWDLPLMLPRFGGPWGYESGRQFLEQYLGWKFAPRRGPELICVPHHRAHAASAFYASGFERAAVLVNDGTGEDESISIYKAGFGGPIVRYETWPRSHSIGLMYEAACQAIGLDFLEAGKTMGLAAYGRARSVEPSILMNGEGVDFRPPFDLGPDTGSKEVVDAWGKRFEEFGSIPVKTSTAHLDADDLAVRIAWSAQATVESLVSTLAEHARGIIGVDSLCIAGGVGLNCSANGLLDGRLFVPPVSHDAGAALGSAWSVAPPLAPREPLSPFLGSEVGELESVPDGWAVDPLDPNDVVERLLRRQVGAVARGRAEVGPRALGNRSIIALPTDVEMRNRINKMKGRELWRPLAPIGTPAADGVYWHGPRELQRYMLGAAEVTDLGRERIAGTVHVDGTARAQVVSEGFISEVLDGLGGTGADPVLINTSFNVRGEPIVNSAEEAVTAAEKIGVDFVAVGDSLLTRV